MSNDSFKLPTSSRRRTKQDLTKTEPRVEVLGSPLQSKQSRVSYQGKNGEVVLQGDELGKVIDRSFDNIGALVDIAKGIIEIKKIREQGKVAVDMIEAQTRQLEKQFAGEIGKLQKENDNIVKRGELANTIIRSTLGQIPPEDRAQVVQWLPQMIEATLKQHSKD